MGKPFLFKPDSSSCYYAPPVLSRCAADQGSNEINGLHKYLIYIYMCVYVCMYVCIISNRCCGRRVTLDMESATYERALYCNFHFGTTKLIKIRRIIQLYFLVSTDLARQKQAPGNLVHAGLHIRSSIRLWNRIGEEQQINSWSHTMEKKTTTEEGSLRDRSCYVVGYAAAVLTSRSTPSSFTSCR